jgi:hypothetical protein
MDLGRLQLLGDREGLERARAPRPAEKGTSLRARGAERRSKVDDYVARNLLRPLGQGQLVT